jgi:hypothetical protein
MTIEFLKVEWREAHWKANSPLKKRIWIRMRTRNQISAIVLGLTMAVAAPFAISQDDQHRDSAKQDMKDAGQHSKDAAKDAGHGVKRGTKKAYHSTKRGTKKAWNKTKDTTKGAVDGGREGARRPD